MALSSMTGFARGHGVSGSYTWAWEIKSVNGKGLDLRLRLPSGWDSIEVQVRARAAEGLTRVRRINSLNVRFLGDRVLQRQAWEVADELGWDTTYDAEYVALTMLQADALVTSNRELAREISDLVETVSIDALRVS